ncbi:hypothetical protein LOS15_03265 [Halomonas sp. 7T]|uniref:COG1470 family protein n=1 Tax=Halomonas sp. 7T TaxID=2893469 RepID=UPI0021DA373A|nr:hypothetical protein [Halomonas sp. 7T]UXZ55069.1 hypothetical protein LOS15_03265 [Halomonas sp. 7T]
MNKNPRMIGRLFFAVAVINILAILFYQAVTYRVFFHSDSAIINVLAGEMVRTGRFFPEEWFYGYGDVWIVYNHVFIAPLLLFFKNSFALHAASGWIFSGLLILSTIYFAKRAQLPTIATFALLATLFTGISPYVSESLFGQMSHGYAWGFLFLLLTLGAVFPPQTLSEGAKSRWHLGALAVLLFLLGLTGVRFLFSILLPLFAVLATLTCVKYLRDGAQPHQRLSYHPVFDGYHSTWLAAVIGFCSVCYGLGLVLNKLWLTETISYMNIASSLTITSFEEVATHFRLFIEGYFFSAGILLNPPSDYSLPTFHSAPIVSLTGVELIFRAVLFTWFFFLPWALLFKSAKEDNRLLFTLVLFYCFSFMLTFIFYVFSNNLAVAMPAIRYFALLQILSAVISIVFIAKLADLWGGRVWHLYFVVVVFHSLFAWQHLVGDGLTRTQNGSVAFKESPFDPLIALLREHNLVYGYASFWNASVNTVLSAGDVNIVGVTIQPDNISPFRVLASEAWYRPSFHQGPTFLLLRGEERQHMQDQLPEPLAEPSAVHEVGAFKVLVYDFNIMDKLYDGSAREPLPASERYGELSGCPAVLEMPAGQERRIALNVTNLSQITWPYRGAYPVRLGAHLLTPNGEPVQADLLRAALTANLAPGEQDSVEILLPPTEAGDYRLDVDLLQEGVAWFGNACTIRLVVR